MQVFVKSLDSTFTVTVSENADLYELKSAIENVEFVPAGLQVLVKGNTPLTPGSLFGVVGDKDTVTLLFGIDGGMRAKWRKKRMRRLRRKRRKMRQRAR